MRTRKYTAAWYAQQAKANRRWLKRWFPYTLQAPPFEAAMFPRAAVPPPEQADRKP